MSERSRSKTLIRELYQLSEAGAFDNVDNDTAETASEFFMAIMNPKLTYKQAAQIFGTTEKNVMNHAQRKLPQKDREKDKRTVISYQKLKRILKRKEAAD